MNEFDRIAHFLAPLAAAYPGARGLKDDASILMASGDRVVTQDTLVETIHFKGDESPDLIARKALRVNLSDLAAKGATPEAYLLSLALPKRCDDAWLEKFSAGLADDQKRYGIHLAGGDSTRSPQHIMITVTAIGMASAHTPDRSSAQVGDGVYVTGTIGDGGLGLHQTNPVLRERYLLPTPRLKEGQAASSVATACLDVSDGLLQDLNHILKASALGARLQLEKLPLSHAAQEWLLKQHDHTQAMLQLITSGDDYELLATASISAESTMQQHGFVRIGTLVSGDGMTLCYQDQQIPLPATLGYLHTE